MFRQSTDELSEPVNKRLSIRRESNQRTTTAYVKQELYDDEEELGDQNSSFFSLQVKEEPLDS